MGLDRSLVPFALHRGGGCGCVDRRIRGSAGFRFLSNQQNIIDHGASLEIRERRYDSFSTNELEKDAAGLDVALRVAGG